MIVSLKENDRVKIYSLNEVEGVQTVSISGFVPQPKTVPWMENFSLFDLIFQSVSIDKLGYKSSVLASRLDLKRFDVNSGLYYLIQFDLNNLELIKNTYLLPSDEIVLYSKSVIEDLTPSVQIIGAVNFPREVTLTKNMNPEDLILLVGGFLNSAEKNYVYINRLNRNITEGTYTTLIKHEIDIDYFLGLKKSPTVPFYLNNYDVVSVISPLRALDLPKVHILGEVLYPGHVILENSTTNISSLIELVGGFSTDYNLQSSYVERDSLKLFLNLNDKGVFDKSLLLKDGDILVIGSKLSSVTTSVIVNNPSTFNWNKGRRAKYYINNSGGKKKKTENIFVQQANGKTEKVSFFKNPKIYPGSNIIGLLKEKKDSDNKTMDKFLSVFTSLTATLTTIILATKL